MALAPFGVEELAGDATVVARRGSLDGAPRNPGDESPFAARERAADPFCQLVAHLSGVDQLVPLTVGVVVTALLIPEPIARVPYSRRRKTLAGGV